MITDFNTETLFGRAAKRERKIGRTGSIRVHRTRLEKAFGPASLTIEDSADGKVHFEWVIEVEHTIIVRGYSYKTPEVASDSYYVTDWSVSTSVLGAKVLEEILGLEVVN